MLNYTLAPHTNFLRRAGAADFIFKRASFTAAPDNMTTLAPGPEAKKRKQAPTDPEPGKSKFYTQECKQCPS